MSQDRSAHAVNANKPKVWLSAAYLRILEPNVFGLYRDALVEEKDQRTGKVTREKTGKPIGPIRLLREAKMPEEDKVVVLRTVHPTTGKEIALVEIE
jgi:hypothetical protein